jgi:E3 ubiquitin-protein ligase HUWE1
VLHFLSGHSRVNIILAEDDMDIFGRIRNMPTAAPEGSVHPLLQDPMSIVAGGSSQSRTARRPPRGIGFPQDLLQSIEHVIGEGAAQLFQQIFTGRGGVPGAEAFRIDVPTGGFIPHLTRHNRPGISTHIRVDRGPRSGDARSEGRSFEPLLTLDRWAEEVKTLHGRFEQSRTSKLANHVALELLPAAIEAHKQAQEEVRKEMEKRREAQAKAEEEEAKRLREEQQEQERQEAEKKRVEQERAAAVAELTAETQPVEPVLPTDTDAEMTDATGNTVREDEDVAVSRDEQAGVEAGPSGAVERERVTVTIHGNPVDITDTGIDPTFLEALPDDMREEVLNQHMRDQRAARVERAPDSQISPEFLDALPPELRAEIIQQENIERARRNIETIPPAPTNAVPVDMNAADFIASLDPQLRQVVLMDSDEMVIQNLPPHMLAEAGIYREIQQGNRPRGQVDANATHRAQQAPPTAAKPAVSRDAIQLLDKHAVAVLIRLLFFPQVLRKNILSKVLVNLSENSRTRTDIFNLLLSILHDGTGDLSSIDKSFAQMSFRNSKPVGSATPRPPAKMSLGQTEVVPELVAQRCLDALAFVTGHNEASSVFFLTEQELPAGLRRTTSKKGKGKEKPNAQNYYPIVLLLGQLDRQSLLRTPTLMEAIVGLLALVTRPLAGLKDSKTKDSSDQPSTSTQAVEASSSQAADSSVVVPTDDAQQSDSAQLPPSSTWQSR